MQSNIKEKVLFRNPQSLEERSYVAGSCVRKLGIKFPAIIDGIENKTENAYTAWPDRMYLIDREGKVVYKSKPGPFGFHPKELEAALERMPKATAQK